MVRTWTGTVTAWGVSRVGIATSLTGHSSRTREVPFPGRLVVQFPSVSIPPVAGRLNSGVRHHMTNQHDFENLYKAGMRTAVTERLTEAILERMRTSAIGGASIALGVILLLLQTKLDSLALIVALYSSIFAIPTWIAAWQYVESYMFCGKPSYDHFNSPKGSLVAVLFAICGMLLLLVAVVSLIWHMSPTAATVFAVVSISVAVVIYRHHNAVRAFADKAKTGGGA